MEVITIESKAFLELMRKLEEIQTKVVESGQSDPDNHPGKTGTKEIWLDNDEASQLLRVSKRTLQNYREKGTLSFSKFGNKIYYKAADIEKHLNKHYVRGFRTVR
ncbi:MAG TPA: helix-turn-helix domain-containing protein [Bacteroidales bacterium]|nr:helix-turn-helix domain-containing protein [Bacteroidales bacterium]